jgi:hypothetical protein
VSAELTSRPPAAAPGATDRPRSADTPVRPAGPGTDVAGGRHLAARSPVFGTDGSRVATLDRLTLHLGVVVAAVIALCSYAVSATSLYALGRQAGYDPWQAVAVPVVADGPAIYGMVRIVSRSRRGARGAGYGWLLVGAGTLASIGGNVAHAQPELVARGIAAAIPLAVLAMLEALKGDTQEVARLAAEAATDPGPPAATADSSPADTRPAAHRVGRVDRAAAPGSADPSGVGELAARARLADSSVRQRLQAAYAGPRTDGRPWTARTLAEAAGCGRTAAARFLRAQRAAGGEATG